MNIAVTGALGFIGGEAVKYLKLFGHKITEVDNDPHPRRRNYFHRVDFLEAIERKNSKLDAIVHLGACTDTLCQDREYLALMNTEYSKHLWTYCAQRQIRFIYASSAATYGDGRLGFNDDYEVAKNAKPLNPYGESKKAFDLWAIESATKLSAPSSWAGLKFFNVYGANEAHKNKMASMVYQAIQQATTTGTIRLFKDGEQKRDFVYVGDVVKVIDFLLSKTPGTQGSPYGLINVGTGNARTFNELAKIVFNTLEMEPKIEYFDIPESIGPAFQAKTEANIDKLKYFFEYHRDFTKLEEGVKLVASALL